MIRLDEQIIMRLQDVTALDEIEGIAAIQYRCNQLIKHVFNVVLETAKPSIDKRKTFIEELTESLRKSETNIFNRQDSLKEIVQW